MYGSDSNSTLQWKIKGYLKIPRFSCNLAAISHNYILVIGGYSDTLRNNQYQATNRCEVINISTTEVVDANSTFEPHAEAALVQRGDSNLVILSGIGSKNKLTSVCEYFDRESKTWHIIGSLRIARKKHSATFIDNEQILVVGGVDSRNKPIQATEILNIKTKQSRIVTEFPSQSTPILCAVSILTSYGKAIAISKNTSLHTNSIYWYDEKKSAWCYFNEYPFLFQSPSLLRLFDNRLLILGNNGNSLSQYTDSSIICIESLSGFRKIASLSHCSNGQALVQWNVDSILVLGGQNKGQAISNKSEWLNIALEKSSRGPNLLEPLSNASSISTPVFDDYGRQYQARVFVVGGKNSQGLILSSIEVLEQIFEKNIWDSQINDNSIAIIWQWFSPTVLIILIVGLFTLTLTLVYLVNSLQRQTSIERHYQLIRRENEQMLVHSIELQLEKEQIQNRSMSLQLQTLYLQMNPHFIFNSLSSLESLVVQQETSKASHYIGVFSRLLRNILNNSDNTSISLQDEILFLREYLALEQLRTGNTFDYSINDSHIVSYLQVRIPAMLTQPYIENSVKYGIGLLQDFNYKFPHQSRKGNINISFHYTTVGNNAFILCTVEDNGVGRKYAQGNLKFSSGLGRSTRVNTERLALLNAFNMQEQNVQYEDLFMPNGIPSGTRVTLYLPILSEIT
jgi:hypothetical protein